MAIETKKIVEQVTGVVNRLNEKNPYYSLGLFLLVLFLADYFLLMQFQLRVLYVLNPKVTMLGKELRETKADIAKMPEYQQEVNSLSQRVKDMNSKIHTREEISLVIDTISRLAKAHGIRVDEILPNASVNEPILKDNEGQYFSVPLLVKARAGYHNFGKFINQVEREENFLSLGDFSIEANPADASHHSIKMNLNAIVFEVKGN